RQAPPRPRPASPRSGPPPGPSGRRTPPGAPFPPWPRPLPSPWSPESWLDLHRDASQPARVQPGLHPRGEALGDGRRPGEHHASRGEGLAARGEQSAQLDDGEHRIPRDGRSRRALSRNPVDGKHQLHAGRVPALQLEPALGEHHVRGGGVVRHHVRQAEVLEVAVARIEDLQRRPHAGAGSQHRRPIRSPGEAPGEAEADLRLDLWMKRAREVEGPSHHHRIGEDAVDGGVERHLPALGLGGETHLHPDDLLALGDAERDAGIHHLVSQGEVEIGRLERQPLHLPAVPPRVVQVTRQALDVHPHAPPPNAPPPAAARVAHTRRGGGFMDGVLNVIDGREVPARAGATLPNWEPATGGALGTLPDSDGTDVAQAVEAARRAFPAWSATPAPVRSRLLRKVAEGLRQALPELAPAESVDSGKPLSTATEMDIPRAILNFEFFADAATQLSSECHPTDSHALNYTLRHPLGVVGTISPWNLPLYLLTWKVAPALAVGNTVGAKPSEVTPVTAHWLGPLAPRAPPPPPLPTTSSPLPPAP